jgi:hypothetical protein
MGIMGVTKKIVMTKMTNRADEGTKNVVSNPKCRQLKDCFLFSNPS